MSTAPSKSPGLPRASAADARATTAMRDAGHAQLAVVAGTFKPLGFLAGGIVQRAAENAALARNGKTKPQERPVTAQLCKNCDAIVDTAKDPDCHVEIGNMRRQTTTEFLCRSCREGLLERKEIQDAAASLHEDQAERAS